MAAATVSNRYIVSLGPIKMEILNLANVTDTNTVTTQLQNPQFGCGIVYTDGSPMTAAINPSFDGREVTINSADLDGDDDLVLLVFGF